MSFLQKKPKAMKESYHIGFTSHNEVMFRDREDHGYFINLMALRAFASETALLADAEMSNHVHLNAFTSDPVRFAGPLRMSYTKYLNYKYGRSGRLGEEGLFILKVRGINHQIALDNYTLRNALHHGAASNAWGYEWCSTREMFAEELGRRPSKDLITDRSIMKACLPRHSSFPEDWVMDGEGVFLRSCFMEIRQTEQFYATPRNFLYQMNRLTDESWIRDQEKDGTGAPVRLEDIEAGYGERDIAAMLRNENGRGFRPDRMQDLDVCHLIDKQLLLTYRASSVYALTETQKRHIARTLYYDFHLPEAQIRRCLVYYGELSPS